MREITKLEAFYSFCKAENLLLKPAGKIAKNLARRALEAYEAGAVMEYELGCAEFAGRFYACNEHTLVPRDDSLVLLECVMRYLSSLLVSEQVGKSANIKVLEIGAGTGILSICLALAAQGRFDADYAPSAKLINRAKGLQLCACDISQEALQIARLNANCARVQVEFCAKDFRDLDFKQFDFVFSNPPYIARDYPLDARVQKEPASALFGGERGDEMLLEIIQKAKDAGLKALACEIGYDQKASMQNALELAGYEAVFFKDFAGFNRAFIAVKKEK